MRIEARFSFSSPWPMFMCPRDLSPQVHSLTTVSSCLVHRAHSSIRLDLKICIFIPCVIPWGVIRSIFHLKYRCSRFERSLITMNLCATTMTKPCAAVLMIVLINATVHAQFVSNITADEWAYAAAVGAVTETWDITTLSGLSASEGKWHGIVYVPTARKLVAAPDSADAVLIVDPVTNTLDTTTLGGLGSGAGKWHGIAFVPTVNKAFAPPLNAGAVLIVDLATNTTDTTSELHWTDWGRV